MSFSIYFTIVPVKFTKWLRHRNCSFLFFSRFCFFPLPPNVEKLSITSFSYKLFTIFFLTFNKLTIKIIQLSINKGISQAVAKNSFYTHHRKQHPSILFSLVPKLRIKKIDFYLLRLRKKSKIRKKKSIKGRRNMIPFLNRF